MSDLNDDAIDRLLLDRFEGPVPDDGFCDRAMQTLPPRRRRTAWPLALGITLGGILCWLSLSATPLVRIGGRDWLSEQPSGPAIILLAVMAGLSLLALAWTAVEADD